MAIQEVTSPPLLDETGQDIVTELQNIVSALSPNAQGISYSHATSGLSAENVQEGIDEVKGITDNISNSLTQLPDNLDFGTPVLIPWTNNTYTCPSGGVITGMVRKTTNTTAGYIGLTSSKLGSGLYRYFANLTSSGQYAPVNMNVVKGEQINIASEGEILSKNIYFIPYELS